MTKGMWSAVFVLILLFAACGAFMIRLQKDEENKNIHYFLATRKINTLISYKDTALSFSDKAVLKRFALRFYALPELKNNIKRLTVHSYKEKDHIPSFLTFTATGVSVSLTEIAQNLKNPEEDVIETLAAFDPAQDILNYPLYALLLAGCDRINADVTGQYVYSPSSGKMMLQTKISDRCLGKWDFRVSLINISNAQQGQFLLAFKHFLQKGNPLNDLKNFLKDASVTHLSLSYTEAELIKGYKKYLDSLYLRLPQAASTTEPDARLIQKIVSYLSISNAHRQRNMDAAQTIAKFIQSPQTIRFESKEGKQVALNILEGTFLRQVTDMLLRLDTSVTLEEAEK